MYKELLILGYAPSFFYEYTVKELYMVIDAARERKQLESKEKLLLNDTLATLIIDKLNASFDKNHKPTPVIEMFPDFFPEEKKKREEELIKQQHEAHKLRFLNYARNRSPKK